MAQASVSIRASEYERIEHIQKIKPAPQEARVELSTFYATMLKV